MTCLKLQISKRWIQGSVLDSWLQSLACHQQSKLVLLQVGCREEGHQPGNLLEMPIPESETLGVGLAILV